MIFQIFLQTIFFSSIVGVVGLAEGLALAKPTEIFAYEVSA